MADERARESGISEQALAALAQRRVNLYKVNGQEKVKCVDVLRAEIESLRSAATAVLATDLHKSYEWRLAPSSRVDEGIPWGDIEKQLWDGLTALQEVVDARR